VPGDQLPGGRSLTPRWLGFALLGIGVLEIPWAIYLAVTLTGSDTAAYINIAAMGLQVAAWMLSLLTAVGAVLRWRGAIATAAMGIALWGAGGANWFITDPLGPQNFPPSFSIPPGLAIPGVLVNLLALWVLLGFRQGSRDKPALVISLACLLLVLLPVSLHVAYMASARVTGRFEIVGGPVSWVVLDIAEVVLLLATGALVLLGRATATVLVGSFGFMLFVADAWYNVVLSHGHGFRESLVFLFIGEVPTAVLCMLAVRAGLRAMPPMRPSLD
jgi:hypothetical protein